MFGVWHATDGTIRDGDAHPTPLCGRAAFEPEALVSVSRFEAIMRLPEGGAVCWECRSILTVT